MQLFFDVKYNAILSYWYTLKVWFSLNNSTIKCLNKVWLELYHNKNLYSTKHSLTNRKVVLFVHANSDCEWCGTPNCCSDCAKYRGKRPDSHFKYLYISSNRWAATHCIFLSNRSKSFFCSFTIVRLAASLCTNTSIPKILKFQRFIFTSCIYVTESVLPFGTWHMACCDSYSRIWGRGCAADESMVIRWRQ